MWENQTQELLAPAVDEDSSAKAIKKLFNLLAKQLKIDGSFFNCLPTLWAIARHDDDFRKKMQKVYNRFQRFIELIILRGIESKEFVNLKPDNAKTPALSLILNFEGIFGLISLIQSTLTLKNILKKFQALFYMSILKEKGKNNVKRTISRF